MVTNGYKIEPSANLSGAYLSYANLSYANLIYANLMSADLSSANLECADLMGAYLSGANLECADLMGANLRGANLRNANLMGANFRGSNLMGVNLYYANDLRGANLERVNLYYANLRGANLEGVILPHFQICPQEGSFVAYKKVNTGVIKLRIPANAKRTSSLVGRKCRAEFVEVLEGSGHSGCGGCYVEGEFVYPDSYDDDIRVECTNGIHFFMTRKEAEEWS